MPKKYHEERSMSLYYAILSRNKETIRKYRREICTVKAKLPSTIIWLDIFPAATPPPSVSIEPAKRKPKSKYHGIYRDGFSGVPRIANFKPSWASVLPAKICLQMAKSDDLNHRDLKPNLGN